MDATTTTAATSEPAGYLGAIDDCRNGMVTGWAVTRFGDECAISVEVNGRVFRGDSNLPRADLAAKSQSRGRGGFSVLIEEALRPGENSVSVRTPDGRPLVGSPRTVTVDAAPLVEATARPATRFIGAIDQVSERSISGWALTAHGDPCAVTITVDGDPAVTLMAHEARPDLAAKGMSTGAGGWRLRLAGTLEPGIHAIAVTLPSGEHLPGSPASFNIPAPDAQRATPPQAQPEQPAPEKVGAVATTPVAAATTERSGPAANIAEFPNRPRPSIPSLTELDELSLDDLTLAVASGMVKVDVPQAELKPQRATADAPEPVPAPEPASASSDPQPRRGFFGRLFGR